MTLREFYVERRRAEFPVFMAVLKAMNPDQMDYKPSERCPTARQLVWTLTWELRTCLEISQHYRTEWRGDSAPSLPEMMELFEKWSNELTELVAGMTEEAWNRPAQFFYQGKMVLEQPIGQFLWFIMFDAIHHRGQLSAYLRPMGCKVPAIYGPSADTPAHA